MKINPLRHLLRATLIVGVLIAGVVIPAKAAEAAQVTTVTTVTSEDKGSFTRRPFSDDLQIAFGCDSNRVSATTPAIQRPDVVVLTEQTFRVDNSCNKLNGADVIVWSMHCTRPCEQVFKLKPGEVVPFTTYFSGPGVRIWIRYGGEDDFLFRKHLR